MQLEHLTDEQVLGKLAVAEMVLKGVIQPALAAQDPRAPAIAAQWESDLTELKKEWEKRQLAKGPHDVTVALQPLRLVGQAPSQ